MGRLTNCDGASRLNRAATGIDAQLCSIEGNPWQSS